MANSCGANSKRRKYYGAFVRRHVPLTVDVQHLFHSRMQLLSVSGCALHINQSRVASKPAKQVDLADTSSTRRAAGQKRVLQRSSGDFSLVCFCLDVLLVLFQKYGVVLVIFFRTWG